MENKIPNTENIKERVLQIASTLEKNKQIFFRKIDMSYGNFTGKAKETPLNSNAIRNILLNYPSVNLNWLITGEGEMEQNGFSENPLSTYIYKDNDLRVRDSSIGYRRGNNLLGIPLILMPELTALMNGERDLQSVVSVDYISLSLLNKEADFAFKFESESMAPTIKMDSILVCRKIDISSIRVDNYYLLSVNNSPMVKRVLPGNEGTYILRSDNNKNFDFEVSKDYIQFSAEILATININ